MLRSRHVEIFICRAVEYTISYGQWGAQPRAPLLSHTSALQRLAALGWCPRTIYDIGAYSGGWSKNAGRIFPAAEFLLFEANADRQAELSQSGYRYFIAALSDADRAEQEFYIAKNVHPSGASLYRENTRHFIDENLVVRKVPTKRLDSLVTAHGLALPDLAKIDTQGSELDVIAGARHALSQCAVVIVETSFLNYNRNAPMFADVVAAFDKLGFKCTDICEIHRARADIVFQLDLLFVNEPLYRRYYSAADLL